MEPLTTMGLKLRAVIINILEYRRSYKSNIGGTLASVFPH